MATVEILAGGGFDQAVRRLDLTSAKCTYRYYKRLLKSDYPDYQVWVLSEEDYKNLAAMDDDEWNDSYGWWRWSAGSILGPADAQYTVNGKPMMAWDGDNRKAFGQEECNGCELACNDTVPCYGERKYQNVIDYVSYELHIGSLKNLCAVCVDMARYNDLTLGGFFQKYLG